MASVIAAGTTSGTAIAISGDTSGALQLQTNGTTAAVTIDTAQGVKVANAIGVGNTAPTTSGAGITFPATQSASTDANTLDDYEEGTFNITIGNFTLNSGVLGFTARYTKIGRQVTINVLQDGNGTISWSGTNYLTGLPFTPTTNGGTAGVYTNSSPNISGSILPWTDNNIYFTGTGSSQNRLTFSATYFTS